MKRIYLMSAMIGGALTVHGAPVLNPSNGHSYEVFRYAGISWADAAIEAGKIDGYLATVCNVDENEFINSLRFSARLGQVWLGGSQPASELVATANWSWENGEGSFPGSGQNVHPYSNWNGGEPNDAYGAGSEQWLGMGLAGNSTWNDESNLGNIAGYVVEWGAPINCPDAGSYGVFGVLGMAALAWARRRSN